jgi:hypothetical protein
MNFLEEKKPAIRQLTWNKKEAFKSLSRRHSELVSESVFSKINRFRDAEINSA